MQFSIVTGKRRILNTVLSPDGGRTYQAEIGRTSSRWERCVCVNVTLPLTFEGQLAIDDGVQFANGEGDLVVGGIKMRRDTDAGARTEVDEDLPADQFCGNLPTIRNIEDDGTPPECGVERAVDL